MIFFKDILPDFVTAPSGSPKTVDVLKSGQFLSISSELGRHFVA